MDISKIRKKAKAKEQEDRPEERPSPQPAAGEEKEAEEISSGPLHELPQPAVEEEIKIQPEIAVHKTGGDSESKAPELTDHEADMVELLTFSLAAEEFAFRVTEVEEIVKLQRITKVPLTPDYVYGITSLRGKIIPVIDMKKRLSLGVFSPSGGEVADWETMSNIDRDAKILILSGPKGLIGAIIDKVIGVVRLSESTVLEPPAHLTEEERRFIDGVVIMEKRFISIIRAQDALQIEVG